MARDWANILTYTRLLLIVPISAAAVLGAAQVVLVLYLVAVLTDTFDGFVARANGSASAAGAELDGAVDLALALATLWWIGLLAPVFYAAFWPFLLVVVAAYALFFVVSLKRLGRIAVPHLWSGKLAMVLFAALLPVLLVWGVVAWYVHIVWVVAALSRVEMAVYVWRGGTDPDARSILF